MDVQIDNRVSIGLLGMFNFNLYQSKITPVVYEGQLKLMSSQKLLVMCIIGI
jgi:hypothetical protein